MKYLTLTLLPALVATLVHAQTPEDAVNGRLTQVEKADREFLANVQNTEAAQPPPAPVASAPARETPKTATQTPVRPRASERRPADPVAARPKRQVAGVEPAPSRASKPSKKIAHRKAESRPSQISATRRVVETPVIESGLGARPEAMAQAERKVRTAKRAIELPASPQRWVKITTVTTRVEHHRDHDDDDDEDDDREDDDDDRD